MIMDLFKYNEITLRFNRYKVIALICCILMSPTFLYVSLISFISVLVLPIALYNYIHFYYLSIPITLGLIGSVWIIIDMFILPKPRLNVIIIFLLLISLYAPLSARKLTLDFNNGYNIYSFGFLAMFIDFIIMLIIYLVMIILTKKIFLTTAST